jgi:hypothetical protein
MGKTQIEKEDEYVPEGQNVTVWKRRDVIKTRNMSQRTKCHNPDKKRVPAMSQ